MGNAPSEDSLPVPADIPTKDSAHADSFNTRQYIEIRPTEAPINPETAIQAMAHLHARIEDLTRVGVLSRVRRQTQEPVVEWLLVSDGRPDPSIRYLVGSQEYTALDDILSVLRECYPDTYEFSVTDWHPRMAEETLPIGQPGETTQVEVGNDRVIDTTITPYVSGVQYFATVDRKRDWQTGLRRFDDDLLGSSALTNSDATYPTDRIGAHRVPLSSVVQTMAEVRLPIIFQVILKPLGDWSGSADSYVKNLDEGMTSKTSKVLDFLSPRDPTDLAAYTPPLSERRRIDSISNRETQRSFWVTARAIALTRDQPALADHASEVLSRALGSLDGPNHVIQGSVRSDGKSKLLDSPYPGLSLYEDLINLHLPSISYGAWRRKIPFTQNYSRGIIADAHEVPGLTLVDGSGLTPAGKRALASRRHERTALPLPPPSQLAQYVPPGMELCMPLTHDRQPYGRPLYLPEALQNRHLVVVGDTGSGKSVLTERAALTNVEATAGPEIIFDYKGGGTAEEYLRMHYAEFGHVDDVYYFDLSKTLPAFSFFDISDLLEAGVPREEARTRKAGHYEEILKGLMGAEKYGEAAESVKAIRNHVRVLFDPVHGDDTYSHADLYNSLLQTLRGEDLPPASDDALNQYFEAINERDRDIFNKVMGGAAGRVERIATDGRLAPLFNHTHHHSDDTVDISSFKFGEQIDEDCVIIFDFAGMENDIKRTLTLVILSTLWTALKAREANKRNSGQSLPQVNLYLEEARDVASTRILDTLLAEGRSFGLSIMMGLQFLEQLQSPDPQQDTYKEALNETATFLVGNISVDTDLPRALATESMDPQKVARRLASMARGEWLVRPGSAFDADSVKPFLARSLPLKKGHPASDVPLSTAEERAFDQAFEDVKQKTASAHSVQLSNPEGQDAEDADSGDDGEETPDEYVEIGPVDSLLPHTLRMPRCVKYNQNANALYCRHCETLQDPNIDGMQRAIECCDSIKAIDRDDIPICGFNLKLTTDEIRESAWSLKQLLFLQAVHNATQLRYDPREYDIILDSMIRLREYVGIEPAEVQELLDASLLQHDTDNPHKLYSTYGEGRKEIGESSRHGIDYGHGKGDLGESSEHVYCIQLVYKWVTQKFAENPESDVETVVLYYDLDETDLPASAFMGDGVNIEENTETAEQRRLDIAGLDADGNVVLAVEVERVNNDVHRAVLDDFDKLADCDLEAAIWVVMSRSDGHAILRALNDPVEGLPRVTKTYSENTPPRQFTIDTPGLTDMYTAAYIRDQVLE